MQILYPRCCGLDVHKSSITGCCLWFDAEGQRREEIRKFGTHTAELRRAAEWLRQHEVKNVVMEATGSYWRPVWNVLEVEGFELTLANPQHMKAVPGRKTDTKDAHWSADLFQHGLIAPSFVPNQQMRHLRDLTRMRTKVTQDRTRVVNRIEAVLVRIPGDVNRAFRKNVNKDSGRVNRGFRQKVNRKIARVGIVIHMSE